MQAEKNVLLISNLFSVGPAYGAVCKDLAEKLTRNDWQVLTTSAVQNRYLRPVDMLMATWLNHNRFRVAQIDVFSGPAFRWAELSAWSLRKLRRPYVLTLHGGDLPLFGAEHPERVERLLSSAAAVTTPSRYLLDQMLAFRTPICLIPNPINVQSYPFQLRSKPAPRIIYLRALHKMYNPCLAVYALQHLLPAFSDAELAVVGPDKRDGAREELLAVIAAMLLQDRVTLLGSVPKTDVPTVLSRSDIFVNTTNVDNTPISVIEAMACGLCIVSTNVGGMPYLLTHEQDALLVPPNDPHAMADAIRRVLTERGLAEKLSRNARAKAAGFDWSVVLPQWEALLSGLAENLQS